MAHDDNSQMIQAEGAQTTALVSLVRFLQVVRLRKGVMLFTLLVSGVIGALHYSTATRMYESSAEVLVLQKNSDAFDRGRKDSDRAIQDMLATYRRLIASDVVVKRSLQNIPREHLGDLRGVQRQDWVDSMRRSLRVDTSRGTNLLSVSYRSKNPESAAVVVNGVLDAYMHFMEGLHRSGNSDQLEILMRDKVETERNLAEMAQELQDLQRVIQVFPTERGTTNVIVERLVKHNMELAEAERETVKAKAFLEAVEQAVRNGESIDEYAMTTFNSLAVDIIGRGLGVERDPWTLGRLNQDLLEDKAKLRIKLTQYGPNHQIVQQHLTRIQQTEDYLAHRQQNVSQQIDLLRENELKPRVLQMARQKLTHAIEQERQARAVLLEQQEQAQGLNAQMARYEFLKLEVSRIRSYLDQLLERMKDIDLQKDMGFKTAIVSPPKVSRRPVSPRLSLVGLGSLFFGVVTGCAIIYLLDTLDDRFRSPEEIRIQIGVPVLSMIRQMKTSDEVGLNAVQTFTHPNGVESESFRTLRTALSFNDDDTQRLVVSSTEPGDGKTTVMANLAVAFAQAGKRTLVIDADMRRPGMSTLLALRGTSGLSTLLRDDKPIAESILENLSHTEAPGLDVLPCGPRPINPAELLIGDRFAELLAWAETQYDQILIDAPPVLAVTDPAIVGRLSDGLILVVRPDKNRRKMVIRAAETLASLKCKLVGIVVNHLSGEREGGYEYGFGYGYGYGYGYGHDERPEEAAAGEDYDKRITEPISVVDMETQPPFVPEDSVPDEEPRRVA
jgi:polysaccharide biosynthesis transport protein